MDIDYDNLEYSFHIINEKEVGIAKCKITSSKNIVIPSQIEFGNNIYDVTALFEKSFMCLNDLETIYIPDSIKSINEKCFAGCLSLYDVRLPKNIEKIEKSAFDGCNSLKELCVDSDSILDIFKKTNDNLVIKTSKREISVKLSRSKTYNWVENLFYAEDDYFAYNTRTGRFITGFNSKFDCKNKKVFYKDNLYYFVDDDNNAIITHGKKAYNFDNQDIVIPSYIDGHKVVAIGNEAFENAIFSTMIIPDSVESIQALAFYYASFNLLRLPKKLKYLCGNFRNNKRGYNDCILENTYEKKLMYDMIVMPNRIDEKDDINLPNETIYEYEENEDEIDNLDFLSCMINGKIHYDFQNDCLYVIKKSKCYLYAMFNKEKVTEIPATINNSKVVGIYTRALNNYGDYYGELKYKVKIPQFIKEIVYDNRFSKKYEDITLHDRIDTLEGIYFEKISVIPQNIKNIRRLSGNYIVEHNVIADDYYENDEHNRESFFEKNGLYYRITRHKGKKVVELYDYDKSKTVLRIPSYVNDKKIEYLSLSITTKINELIFDNIFALGENQKPYSGISIIDDGCVNMLTFGKSFEEIKNLWILITRFPNINLIRFEEGIKRIYYYNPEEPDFEGCSPECISVYVDTQKIKKVFIPKSVKDNSLDDEKKLIKDGFDLVYDGSKCLTDLKLLKRLRRLRVILAKNANQPAFWVVSNKTLVYLATYKPKNEKEILNIYGFGSAKYEKHGKDFLDEINKTE